MRFDNEGMTLWFDTPDALGPGETVLAGAEIAITIAVQPGDRSNKIEVRYRVNKGSDETVTATWARNDASANAQYFRARLPPRLAGDTVEYIPVCRRAGRTVPSEDDIKRGGPSFRVTEAPIESPGKAPSGPSGPVAAPGAERAPTANRTAMLKENSPGTGDPRSAKTPFGAGTESGGGSIVGMGIAAAESHTEPTAANKSDPTAKNAVAVPNDTIRIDTLTAVLATKEDKQAVETELQAAKGDWTAALVNLKDKLPEPSLKKIDLVHSLAVWSDDHVPVVKAVLAAVPDLTNLRDLALRFNVDKLTALVDPKAVPETTPGATAEEKQKNFAVGLRQKLFSAEPTAVLHRMVEDAEIPIADGAVRSGVTKFLRNQPDFNIGTTSIYTALKHPESFKDIADEHRGAVVDHLKVLQRVQGISPVPEAVPALMKANLTSAFHVAEKTESTFLRAFSPALGEDTARQVYTNAINSHIRNEHALIAMRQTMRGTGLAIIDGKQTQVQRVAALQKVTDDKAVPLNLETLFGGLDYCECDECLSVYSPASYFVELLQFLRNNDLGSDPATPGTPPVGNPKIHPKISDTPLEKLFRRRPDLGCLELTCENTFTVLPYIDLVNEVMESFVVHVGEYHNDTHIPKQVTLETFNVEGEASSELLAIPQHINYDAYCILKNEVYPFTLPYHQPIDATRILLDYLKTSRWELLDTFRTAHEVCPESTLTQAELQKLEELHQEVIERAVDAEFLGLTQEEYIILTREAFWPKRYFDLTQNATFNEADYQQKIGVKPVHEYYGYQTEADMLSLDEAPGTGQKGLTFVKKQYLQRSGVQYVDLVELLKTRFVNPNFPQGKALTILESIRFSYRYLQSLVDPSTEPKIRFAKLIEFLEIYQPLVPAIKAQMHPDPCKQHKVDLCAEREDFKSWVCCYFERIGRLIVLESGEGPQLPLEGPLLLPIGETLPANATLHKDGTITSDTDGAIIGNVTITGQVSWKDGKSLIDEKVFELLINDENGKLIGLINKEGLIDVAADKPVKWLPPRDTCDLDKVRLTHLDGTPVTALEYDRMQQFIRLWRKLGWTIDETDQALIGLAAGGGKSTGTEVCGVDTFVDACSMDPGDGGGCQLPEEGCPGIVAIDYMITPAFLHQLRAVKKLIDQTGLPLPKLLAFWANISTAGQKSLYAKFS
jgi:hypothetical protein